MQSLFINLILSVSLLVGCTVPMSPRASVSHEPIVADRPSDTVCDFSSYSPVRIEQFNRRAIIKRVQPEYPPEAAQAGIQGRVVVKALINEKGLVEKGCAIEGEQQLRRAAEKAALQWKFKPGYGLAFIRPKTEKNPKNFAEAYIVFEFKADRITSKVTTTAHP